MHRGSMPHTTLVTTDSLYVQLDEPEWAIVDCRYDLSNETWGREQYAISHIPGAAYASLGRDLAGAKTGTNGRHPLPSPDALRATFGRLGIGPGVQVVAYDQDTGMYAARLWWLLRYMGHEAVAVLDGGFARWVAEGRPTSSGDETHAPRTFDGEPHDAMRVTAADIERHLGDPALRLIDARAAERYAGLTEPIDRVAGHIPGAVNRFYKDNLSPDGRWRAPSDLREDWLRVLGSQLPERAVSYCGSGVTACHNLLALEHAGLAGARLYPGSWSEWSADPGRPVEKGEGS
jgi:thiosulfate/3-mercaptopyruvate sulfurtransferase